MGTPTDPEGLSTALREATQKLLPSGLAARTQVMKWREEVEIWVADVEANAHVIEPRRVSVEMLGRELDFVASTVAADATEAWQPSGKA